VRTAQATASKARCISANQSAPEKVMVRIISPVVRCTLSITPLLLGLRMVVGTGLIP
jgi:hypothetical protein